MRRRLLNLLESNSFLLFGPRGVGKTTLVRQLLPEAMYIDLLDSDEEYRLSRDPGILKRQVASQAKTPEWIVIDEVQKVPKLLDAAHQMIERDGVKFGLTGSSARKLKRGGANLLAGRAFVYHLHPFTHLELGEQFSLEEVLLWGSLPRVLALEGTSEREIFLESYADTYLREEIIAEQLVRNVTPFRHFLEVAGQTNGEPINFSKIARDVQVEDTTVRGYYEILEDTLVGFRLPPYGRSVRKQQSQSSKFYLFDCGVKRALARFALTRLVEGSSEYGRAFEHFIILECFRLNDYTRTRANLSYLRTKNDVEVDLILERPGGKAAFIEIKSTRDIHQVDINGFLRLVHDTPGVEGYVLCREERPQQIDGVRVLPWADGLRELFGLSSAGSSD